MSEPEDYTVDRTAMVLALCAIALVNLGLFLRFKTDVDPVLVGGVVFVGAACAVVAFLRLRRAGKG